MTNSSELRFESITKRFGATVALIDFELPVASGELVTLLGPSGCGKTTALRIAAGFEVPDTGRVIVNGVDITTTAAHRRNMGMVFQNYSLFPNMTVFDNVMFGLRMRRDDRSSARRRVDEMLQLVRLDGLATRFPHQLSGGQQQRVALARALAFRPAVLLLDEPLSALDAKVRAEIREEIRQLTTRLGTTTLLVTHDQDEALGISDRICVMDGGRIEQVGTPTEIYDHPVGSFVADFVGEMNRVQVGVDVLALRPEQVILEPPSSSTLDGIISAVSFHGSFVRYSVTLDDEQRLTAIRPRTADAGLATGCRIGVRIPKVGPS